MGVNASRATGDNVGNDWQGMNPKTISHITNQLIIVSIVNIDVVTLSLDSRNRSDSNRRPPTGSGQALIPAELLFHFYRRLTRNCTGAH